MRCVNHCSKDAIVPALSSSASVEAYHSSCQLVLHHRHRRRSNYVTQALSGRYQLIQIRRFDVPM